MFEHEVDDLVRQLETLVSAKLSPTNGAFASLTEICLANLPVRSSTHDWGANEPNGLDLWLGDLKRVAQEAKVRIHADYRGELSAGDVPCSFCKPVDSYTLDSAPVIPEEEE